MTYDGQIASDYARLRKIHSPLLAALISGSGIDAGAKVLELGCGTGGPETINLERYPRIDTLDVELRRAGLHSLRQEEVSTAGQLRNLSLYRAKAFSALRLLSEDDYERGLRRLETDFARGPVLFVSRYLLLWAKR